MQGSDKEVQIRAELEQIMPLVSALTGLPTRWSGRVELVDTTEFKGKKRFTCDIQIAADLAGQDVRWTTLIHESLHCHSAGYNGNDYRDFRGWEEGVVEQLQRLFRPQILTEIGINVSVLEGDFDVADSQHPFNDRVQALESIRLSLMVPNLEFYRLLLTIPIAERSAEVLRQVQNLPTSRRIHALYVFSASQFVLRQYPLS
jgi:hypothetical protein